MIYAGLTWGGSTYQGPQGGSTLVQMLPSEHGQPHKAQAPISPSGRLPSTGAAGALGHVYVEP